MLEKIIITHLLALFTLSLAQKWGFTLWYEAKRPKWLLFARPCNFCFIWWASLAIANDWQLTGVLVAAASAGLFRLTNKILEL